MLKTVFTILCFFCFFNFFAQDKIYARKIIDTLASEYFEGRGATNNGERKAAEFIAKEYRKLNLRPLKNSYFQEFNYPINTFPKTVFLQVDETILTAGSDYIVGGSSSKINGTFSLIWYNKENIPSKAQLKKLAEFNFFFDKFIVIDDLDVDKRDNLFHLLKLNIFGAAGIIFLEDKLTKSVSTTFVDYAILKIKRENISRSSRSITLQIDQKFIRDYRSQNVIGYVPGTLHPDSFIILSAHYDHLGRMGKDTFFPGANDNASGTAMLLNLAKHYSKHPPRKSILFIAFGAEEAGIIGSKFFIDHPLVDLKKVNFVFNMDLMGTGIKGATIVNGSIFPDKFKKIQAINKKHKYLLTIQKRGKAANSDHFWFSEKGIPSFFMYTLGGIKAYHDITDVSETLPLNKFDNCFRLIHEFVSEL